MFLFIVVGIVISVASTYLSVYITSYVVPEYMARIVMLILSIWRELVASLMPV